VKIYREDAKNAKKTFLEKPSRALLLRGSYLFLHGHARITLFLTFLFCLILATCQASSPSITLAFLGDVMLGRSVDPSAESFAYLIPHLFAADLVFANLESPFTNAPVQTQSDYVLCAPPENAAWLAQWGLDVLTLANNHILDCGQAGMAETQESLSVNGLAWAGPGDEALHLQEDGVQLALLAFDDVSNPFDIVQAAAAVQHEHEAGNIVIVSIHWGMEYQGGASNRQEEIAQELADAGATLIWGHHPHVLQESAWLNDGQTLVLYSLGNALFDQYGLEDTRQSALILIEMDRGGILSVEAVPFGIDVAHSLLVEPEAADSESILERFNQTTH